MVTAIIGTDRYKTELIASTHNLLADEPEEKGGRNTGPGPGEFLMMALASCTAITLRMYADRKKWAVTRIRVEVGSERIDKTTTFLRHIYVEGILEDEQRQRMLAIANACPVHQTLTNPIEVKTQLL